MNKVVFDTLLADNTLQYNAFRQNLSCFNLLSFFSHSPSSLVPRPSSSSFFLRPLLSYWVVAVVVVARVWVVSVNVGEFNFDGSSSVWFWVLEAVILIVSMVGVSSRCLWLLLGVDCWLVARLGVGLGCSCRFGFGFNYCCVVGGGFNRLF